MVAVLTAKVGKLKKALRLLMCTGKDYGIGGKEVPLFPTVALKLSGNEVECLAVSAKRTVVMHALFKDFDLDLSGDEEMTVALDCAKVMKFISGIASGDEQVKLTFDSDYTRLEFKRDVANIPAITVDSVSTKIDKLPFPVEAGLPKFKDGPPDTHIEIDVKHFSDMDGKAALVGARVFPLQFTKECLIAVLGDKSNRAESNIQTRIDDGYSMEGPGFDVTLSEGFDSVFGNMEGRVKIHGRQGFPLWVVKETPERQVQFLLSPQVDDS